VYKKGKKSSTVMKNEDATRRITNARSKLSFAKTGNSEGPANMATM
jgi:hypothetical protein